MADGVVYEVTVGSGENSKESSTPKSVFNKTLSDTETMLNALVAPQ
jgi:hypothetical protein